MKSSHDPLVYQAIELSHEVQAMLDNKELKLSLDQTNILLKCKTSLYRMSLYQNNMFLVKKGSERLAEFLGENKVLDNKDVSPMDKMVNKISAFCDQAAFELQHALPSSATEKPKKSTSNSQSVTSTHESLFARKSAEEPAQAAKRQPDPANHDLMVFLQRISKGAAFEFSEHAILKKFHEDTYKLFLKPQIDDADILKFISDYRKVKEATLSIKTKPHPMEKFDKALAGFDKMLVKTSIAYISEKETKPLIEKIHQINSDYQRTKAGNQPQAKAQPKPELPPKPSSFKPK